MTPWLLRASEKEFFALVVSNAPFTTNSNIPEMSVTMMIAVTIGPVKPTSPLLGAASWMGCEYLSSNRIILKLLSIHNQCWRSGTGEGN